MVTKLSWKIVDRYLAGEATAAERALVRRWLAESAVIRLLLAELYRSTLDDTAVRQAAADVRSRLERDMMLTTGEHRHRKEQERSHPPLSRRIRGLRAAAVLMILVGGPLVATHTIRHLSIATSPPALRTVTAPVGQRIPVSLPDGSQVILSPGTTIRYASATFGAATRREVSLEGEAYFNVRHNGHRPFVVRARDLVVEDLGTEFVIRAYPEDHYGRVVVREGLVGLAGTVVAPGELGRMAPDGKAIIEPADTISWFAWTRGRLAFAPMPLREALPKLSRWYGVQFRLADPSLGNIELAGYLPARFSDDALKALELALRLRSTRDGGVVTFHPLHARSLRPE